MSAHTTRKRRLRHQQKAAMRFGRNAKPKHTLKAGRTGSVHSKRVQGNATKGKP